MPDSQFQQCCVCETVSSNNAVYVKQPVPTGFLNSMICVVVSARQNNDNEPPSLMLFSEPTDEKLVINKCWPNIKITNMYYHTSYLSGNVAYCKLFNLFQTKAANLRTGIEGSRIFLLLETV